ncbi:aminopeptidase Y [Patellaria atrata CBS 101060]|uniref:Peptide hydrolase n=1 Tax=Patellaria atrata CBS 101060 TaxID=1346257 RepID=A0A9P4VPI3_9PEZI|nr:aminopeptidase Y [Patellaria atrata CBS 101060]
MKFLAVSAAVAALASVASANTPFDAHHKAPTAPIEARQFHSFPKNWRPKFPPLPRLPWHKRPGHGPRSKPLVRSDKLQSTIKAKNLLEHAENLQAIAYATTARNRVFGSPGHNFTALYIYELLSELDEYYTVSYQPFVELWSGGGADVIVEGTELTSVSMFTYSPNGEVEAPIVQVANLGCEAADYPAEVEGAIALISRGTCEFGLKTALAGSAGAVGAIIYNNVEGPIAGGTLATPTRPEGPYPPVAGISGTEGAAIIEQLAAGPVSAILDVEALSENRTTMNVIAQTKGGDQNNVIMVGAHADSVNAGPGINDDGSGTVGILEVALQLAKFKTKNAVRFGFWSAEEFGLLGSEYYVSQLSEAEKDKIRLYLNFDMIASPNYIYSIYDGDGDAFNITGPPGSAEAEAHFEAFYESKRLPHQPTAFDGRSDYGPFLDAGIAAGGIFTGAEQVKTEEEAALYGGEAGVAYDINYHQAGDTVDNLNMDAFVTNTKAIADSVAFYGRSFSSLPAKAKRVKRSVPLVVGRHAGCHHEHVDLAV